MRHNISLPLPPHTYRGRGCSLSSDEEERPQRDTLLPHPLVVTSYPYGPDPNKGEEISLRELCSQVSVIKFSELSTYRTTFCMQNTEGGSRRRCKEAVWKTGGRGISEADFLVLPSRHNPPQFSYNTNRASKGLMTACRWVIKDHPQLPS